MATKLEELKAKWEFTGMDVEKMMEDIVKLLHTYKHKATKYGAYVLLDEYMTNKAPLIRLMMRDPKYNGNLQIVRVIEMERENPRAEIRKNVIEFRNANADKLLSRTNKEGKTMEDLIKGNSLPRTISLKEIGSGKIDLDVVTTNLDDFDSRGFTTESVAQRENFLDAMEVMVNIYSSTIDETVVDAIKRTMPDFRKIGKGQKTARAFQALCKYFGIDTSTSEFQKWFARYSDMVSGLKRKMTYVISVNPIDYYTMSFGKSWASCHTIDYNNIRRMPGERYNGMYRGGTQSYMLDNVSIVTYILDENANKEHPEMEAKIFRNMMHYENGMLVQGRIYPQGKDGATDLYKTLRNNFQEIWKPLINAESDFVLKKGSARNYDELFDNNGTHYPDTTSFADCNISYVRDYPRLFETQMEIGHSQINTVTGEEMFDHNNLFNRYGDNEDDYPDSLLNEELGNATMNFNFSNIEDELVF